MIKRKVISAVLLAIIALAIMPKPVFAAPIDTPDTMVLHQIEAYRNTLELNDQLYLFTYTIEYAMLPIDNASINFVARLMDGIVQLGTTTPYPFFTDGYAYGVMSLYFSAADAPAWAGGYTVRLEGNPTLVWSAGVPPSTQTAVWSLEFDDGTLAGTETQLTNRMRALAIITENDWGIDLIQTTPRGRKLAPSGEDYFTNVVLDLRSMCPNLFTSFMSLPTFETRDYTQSYEATLSTTLVGTIFDMTPLADNFGMSRMWFSSIVWIVFSIVVAVFVTRFTDSFRPMMITLFLLLPFGGLMGFMPLVVTIVATFFVGLGIVYTFFYRGAT